MDAVIRQRTILLAAVEPSADALGAALLRALRPLFPGARFIGCGGPQMAAEGFTSAFDTSPFSVMGFTDVARVIPLAWKRARQIAAMCATEQVDVAVFVDGWTFSRLASKRIRALSPRTRIVKYGAPQIWASRPQRIDFVKEHFDLVLTLLPFEPPYFQRAGVPAEFVGNPNFEAVARAPRSGHTFRARYDLGAAPILCVLPGSRRTEVRRLLQPFGAAVEAVAARVPGLVVVLPVAPAVEADVRAQILEWPFEPLLVPSTERFDAFEAADVALAASGTVTTELAMTDTPMVVGYRVDGLTARWARRVLITPYVTIINVYAGELIIPERIQEACTPEQLAADVTRLFLDDEARRRQLSAFRRLLPGLVGRGQSAETAARAVLRLANGE